MSAEEIRYRLQTMTRKYIAFRILDTTLLGLAVAAVFIAVGLKLGFNTAPLATIATACVVGFVALRIYQTSILRVGTEDFIRSMNRKFPDLQESGELLLINDDELTGLQRLQKIRNAEKFESIYPTIRVQHNLVFAVIVFVACVAISSLLLYLPVTGSNSGGHGAETPITDLMDDLEGPAILKKVLVVVQPPAYTKVAPQHLKSLALNIAEGSNVAWQLTFSQKIKTASLILYGRDTLVMTDDGNKFTSSTKLLINGFYQVSWTNIDGSKKYSDYFPINVARDQPPIVKITNLEQFIQLSMDDKLQVDLKSTLEDDYGLRDGYVIATVSKGSGESVKFREEKLKFDQPSTIQGKSMTPSVRLDLKKLGLDPGDELYFYVEALDTKEPKANKTRTETYFIALKDTTEMETSVDPGLGVDLLPEYFRSQRQIIIDTEKLLKEKLKITQQSFKSKSNELGYDEKVLRLRYGEFLGEEFTTSIGPQGGPPADEPAEQDVAKAYGHQHDTEKEHAAVEESKPAHSHATNDKDGKVDPSKEYMHAHDSDEEATFFTMSIRAKLKAAVSIMWDAELHLRLFEPAKSLPYQYKALKLLKEISQDSRVYVHRTGFDPPPLKEEKRLTGELTEIKNTVSNKSIDFGDTYPAIRIALILMEKNLSNSAFVVTPALKSVLLKAGNELSGVAMIQPGRYLKSLSLLKALAEGELKSDEMLEAIHKIRSSFYSVLPVETYSPGSKERADHPLDDQFLDNLSTTSKDPRR